jgi:hypothetical protein
VAVVVEIGERFVDDPVAGVSGELGVDPHRRIVEVQQPSFPAGDELFELVALGKGRRRAGELLGDVPVVDEVPRALRDAIDDAIETTADLRSAIAERHHAQPSSTSQQIDEVGLQRTVELVEVAIRHAGVANRRECPAVCVVQRDGSDVRHVPDPYRAVFAIFSAVDLDLLHRHSDTV